MATWNISIRQMITFREVMRCGSVSRAASLLHRTQPAVSTAIANLESELGFSLFDRGHGKLTPTPEAKYFLEECEAVLDRLDRARHAVGRVNALNSGHLRIACHPAAANLFMPRTLRQFLSDKENVKLTMVMRASSVIEDLIAAQQFDLGFAESPQPRASIDAEDFDLECVCVLRRSDPLARERMITTGHLDGRPLALLLEDHPVALSIADAFASTGCSLNNRISLRTFLPGLEFVAAGMCYMICDTVTAYSHILHGPYREELVLRKFLPRIGSSVSIMRPSYTVASLITTEFAKLLRSRISVMQSEVARALVQA